MARGVNKVILIGNIGKPAELKYFPNGDVFCSTSMATSESWTDKATGEKKERTEWHNLVFTRRLAEIAAEYLNKGSKAYVEGSLRTRKWQDKDGQDRYTTEIVVNDLQLLDPRPERQEQQRQPAGRSQPPARTQAQAEPPNDHFEDDDIPF